MSLTASPSSVLLSSASISNVSSSKTLVLSTSSSLCHGVGNAHARSFSSSFSNSRLRRFCCRPASSGDFESSALNSDPAAENGSSFCIIEGPETVKDFFQMQLQEIQDNIRIRRNKIFLLMEEVRRLRVQQRIRSSDIDVNGEEENEMPDIPSSIPFLVLTTKKTLKHLYVTCFSLISGIIVFGGLLAPTLELKLGLGGTSYEDFIYSLHLPLQLSEVDPIVASFSGGAVGVVSCLMLIEANNVGQQEKKRCKYCKGSGYLACAKCCASGEVLSIDRTSFSGSFDDPLYAPKTQRCPNCSGAGKVMCPICLCTGMAMATENDMRIDPFD